MTAVLGAAVQIVAAAVLLLAGAQKLASPAKFAATVRTLRLPGVRVLAVGVPMAEVATAVLVLTRPTWAAAPVAALGAGFGAAGLMAVRQKTVVACACFGPLDTGFLGLRQVALAPVWFAVAAAIAVVPGMAGLDGLVALIAIAQAAGLVAAGYLMVPWFQQRRADRVMTR